MCDDHGCRAVIKPLERDTTDLLVVGTDDKSKLEDIVIDAYAINSVGRGDHALLFVMKVGF